MSPGTCAAHISSSFCRIDSSDALARRRAARPGSARRRSPRGTPCRRAPARSSETARPPQQRVRDAVRAGDRLVVEEVVDHARRRLPAHVPHLPRLRAAPCCRDRFPSCSSSGRRRLPTGRRPARRRSSRECRRRVTVSTSARALQAAGREPLALVPAPDLLAHRGLGDPERQQALRPDRRLDLLVVDERRRAAELAALPDALGIEDRDRLAALALDGALLGLPAAQLVGHLAQRAHEIELLDLPGRA